MHVIIDGRDVAEDIYASLRSRRSAIPHPIRLGILVGSNDPVIESFVRIKSRAAKDLDIEIVRNDLALNATTEDVMQAIRSFSPTVDAVIVQLPLPEGIDINAVLTEIPKMKDVDGISPLVSDHDRPVQAPVARAVGEILDRTHVDPRGMRAVVVGGGRLVGAPAAHLLRSRGADVTMFTLDEGSIEDLQQADIVVLGAGNPGFIRPEHIHEGVVLIDAGTSESAGVIVGDADPECAGKASVFTPVPGGVGPIAVAMIFKNILDLVESQK